MIGRSEDKAKPQQNVEDLKMKHALKNKKIQFPMTKDLKSPAVCDGSK